MSSLSENRVRIFVSYKHNPTDEKILNQLMNHIHKSITDAGGEFWFDKQIKWGEFWDATIQEHLAEADIALTLVSQPFLDSTYIADVEINTLVKRREKNELIILPIILRVCDWKFHKWLSDTQFFPLNNKTVLSDYRRIADRDALFQEILQHLRDHILEIRSRKAQTISKAETEGFLGQKLQILQNARKEEVTKDRSDFIFVANKMTEFVYKNDLDGKIRIGTHSCGPWTVTYRGQQISLDETLSDLLRELTLRKGKDAVLDQVQIVCPLDLSNLHYIRKWHIQGAGVRINQDMDQNIFKWLISRTLAQQELLVGYPSGTLEFPIKGTDGLVQHGKASTGLRTRDLLAVNYFGGLFDNLYREGHELQGKGRSLLAITLVDFINSTFQEWEDDKAKLLQPSQPTVTFEKRDINIEVKWQDTAQIFLIDIKSDNKTDAGTLKRHLELLRQSQEYKHYRLDDTLEVTISS